MTNPTITDKCRRLCELLEIEVYGGPPFYQIYFNRQTYYLDGQLPWRRRRLLLLAHEVFIPAMREQPLKVMRKFDDELDYRGWQQDAQFAAVGILSIPAEFIVNAALAAMEGS